MPRIFFISSVVDSRIAADPLAYRIQITGTCKKAGAPSTNIAAFSAMQWHYPNSARSVDGSGRDSPSQPLRYLVKALLK
jgi:hypothetical protein